MKAFTDFVKRVVSWPIYLLTSLGVLLMLTGLKGLEKIHGKKVMQAYIKEILNFDQAEITTQPLPTTESPPLKLFLYK